MSLFLPSLDILRFEQLCSGWSSMASGAGPRWGLGTGHLFTKAGNGRGVEASRGGSLDTRCDHKSPSDFHSVIIPQLSLLPRPVKMGLSRPTRLSEEPQKHL